MKMLRITFGSSSLKALAMIGCIAAAPTAAVPAHAGVNDPAQLLYFFPGTLDNGGVANTGTATIVLCSSFSAAIETLQYLAWNNNGALVANQSLTIAPANTRIASTKLNPLYTTNLHLGATGQNPGLIAVLGTSTNTVCTAAIIDASASVPSGINLHGLRFNPISGTVE